MHKQRILIVDDDVSFLRLLKLNLDQTNRFIVRVEHWPEDAYEVAREFKPDLVFLDVMMPRMFGGNIAASLRSDPELKSVPIVFLTAAIQPWRIREHEGMIGAYPFLAKPASLQQVLACIDSLLNPAGVPAVLAEPRPGT